MWRDSGDTRKRIINWLDAHSDYAMTIDMPLWARLPQFKHTPFHKCSVQELIDLSVDNLKYIKVNTNGDTKWLNVLQGTEENDSKLWWDAVKRYRMGGWALAGGVGWRGGLENVLYYTLLMRDDNAFARGQDWLHVLGVSQPTWAVLLTAIQRAIRKHCKNPNMRVSKWYEKQLYIFEYGADIKLLKSEFPTQFRAYFEIDEELIDKLDHYVYSFRWLNKYATLIDRDIEMLDFIKDKNIGDEKLIEAIPNFMMGTEEFLKQINISIMDVAEKACAIFRSGWK
jgi:hypothetical protein